MSDSPSMVVLTCTCGQKMKIPEDALGRTFKCVRCGAHTKSGEENTAPLAPAPAAPAAAAAAAKTEPTVDRLELKPNDTPPAQEPIGQLLIDGGVITEEQLNDALEKQRTQGGKTFELLIALGYLDKDLLHDFLSRQPGIAAIDLSRCNISPELVKLVPKKLAVENLVLPIDQLGKLLTVAMACPLDTGTITTLEQATGLRVKGMLCRLEDIHAAVQKYYPDRSRMELSPSSFDKILGSAEGAKEKVDDKILSWSGIYVTEEQRQSLLDRVRSEESLEVIARILEQEVAFGPFFMRVANSEFFGMPGQVDSVPMAFAVLGKEGVTHVLEELIEPVTDRIAEPLIPFYEQALLNAEIARSLASMRQGMGAHAAFALGMLGELGRIALVSLSPMKYKRVKPSLYGDELIAMEERFFTMNHSDAAATALETWRFPLPTVRALRHYVAPEAVEETGYPARLLKLALFLAHADSNELPAVIEGQKDLIAALQLDGSALVTVVEEARSARKESMEKTDV